MGNCLSDNVDEEEEKSGLVEKSPNGQARQHDKNFKGPISDRSCTDIIFCAVFAFCIFLLIVCSIIAFARGDPRRIIYPTNSDGQICGQDIPDRTKLVYFDFTVCARMGPAVLQVGCPTPQVCVRSCPQAWWSWAIAYATEEAKGGLSESQRRQMVCLLGRDGLHEEYRSRSVKELVESKVCAPFTMPSTELLGRCLPKVVDDVAGKIVGGVDSVPGNVTAGNNKTVGSDELKSGAATMSEFVKFYGVLQAMFQDVVGAWQCVLGGCVLAMVICLAWLLMLRYTARIMVYAAIAGFLFIFAFLTAYSAFRYSKLRRQSQELQETLKLTTDVGYYSQLSSTWLAILILSSVTLIIVALLLLWLRHRIAIAIAIIAETSKCIASMLTTLFFPIVPFVMQLVILVFSVTVAMHIGSMGKAEMRGQPNQTEIDGFNYSGFSQEEAKRKLDSMLNEFAPCDPSAAGKAGSVCRFVKYGQDDFASYMHAFNLFMFFWLFNFVDALCQMTLAGAFASYYFAFDKEKDLPSFPLLQSFWRCIRYHLGSIAFGSLLVALIQLVRVGLEYVDAKLKAANNPVTAFFIKCLKCCFWCLEKFIKFLNKNAYIMVAIYGRNFCLSAKDAFFLILRNVVRVAVVDQITDFVLLVSKLVVVGLVGAIAFFFFDGTLGQWASTVDDFTPKDMEYYFVPVIIIVVFAYACSCLFFSVYSMGVDTIFLCFLEDLERNDGSAEKPYFMPKDLMEVLGKENKAE